MNDLFKDEVRRLYDREEPGLDDRAKERIIRRTALEGSELFTRARRSGLRSWAFGIAAAAAAATALLVIPREPGADVAHQDKPARGSAESHTKQARFCDSFTKPTEASFREAGAETTRLDLGRVALAVATKDAMASAEVLEACETVVTLDSGTLMVHARDLGGGELRVRAPSFDVIVHGTVFAVRGGLHARVEVVEGVVEVRERSSERVWTLRAGQALAHDRNEVSVLERTNQDEILAALGLGPVRGTDDASGAQETRGARDHVSKSGASLPNLPAMDPPVTSEHAEDLFDRADRFRKSRNFIDARALYRRAGAGPGETAETAWLSLARMELDVGASSSARVALNEYRRRFGDGRFGPEAQWIRVRVEQGAGDHAAARLAAQELLRRWPNSPQAQAARAVVDHR